MYRRHFTDVFCDFSNVQSTSQCSDDGKKLKRRPNCKTRNKHVDESSVQMCDHFYHNTSLFASPNSEASQTGECSASTDIAELEPVHTECPNLTGTSLQRTDSLTLFDILCSSFRSSESIMPHHAAALSRWLSHRNVVISADSSLVEILMASKCPLVSSICCRLLKQLCMTFLCPPTAESSLVTFDVISYMLFLQKEMVKFLETGQFSMKLINMICLLEGVAVICRNLLDYGSRSRLSSQFYSRWCSSELRWAVLSVVSLANVVSAKVKLMSVASKHAVDADRRERSVTDQVERVPQIARTMLCTSVQCEVTQVRNISRILNEYWHTTDVCQRHLIVESVLVPKLRVELCLMILARHCNILLQESIAASLSLDDIVTIFDENAVISAITQQVWMEENNISVASHCQEICLVLCNAICSYMQYRKGDSVCCLLLDMADYQLVLDVIEKYKELAIM